MKTLLSVGPRLKTMTRRNGMRWAGPLLVAYILCQLIVRAELGNLSPPRFDLENLRGGRITPDGIILYEGYTISVIPGEWSDAARVEQEWVDIVTSNVITNGTHYTAVEEDLGWVALRYRETAYGAGGDHVSVQMNDVELVYPDALPAPPFGNPNYPPTITGGTAPGDVLTHVGNPNAWVGGADTVTHEWIKNDVPTGSHTETYADTADGDLMLTRETGTNFSGISTIDSARRIVSETWTAIARASKAEVDQMVASSVGRAPACNRLQVKNHTTGTYEWNTNLWCSSLLRKMTAVRIATWGGAGENYDNSGWYESYGGVLVTPRHLLHCGHAYPNGNGPWGPGPAEGSPWKDPPGFSPGGYPARKFRFLTADNSMVEIKQISDACPTLIYASTNANYYMDIAITVLEHDVPDGISVMPLWVDENAEWPNGSTRPLFQDLLFSVNMMSVIGVSQGYGRRTSQTPPTGFYAMALNDPVQNQTMMYVINEARFSRADAQFAKFFYRAWDGDSGQPVFILMNGQPFVYNIGAYANYYGGVVGQAPGSCVSVINDLIKAADARAVAQSGMSASTGYRVCAATARELLKGMPAEWWKPVPGDTNKNGIPDWWEQKHFGADAGTNPEDDSDNDGHSNLQEYIADTDPTNNSSFLGITGLQLIPTGLQIDWKGGTSVWQYLESRQDLLSTDEQWTTIFSNPPPTPWSTNILFEGVTNQSIYYRIKAVR